MLTASAVARSSEQEARAGRAAAQGRAPSPGVAPLAPPAGMRDLLAPESLARRARSRAIVALLGRHGYELVTTPPFEHAEVLERGLGAVDRRDLLRFVEPESGEVALLRPDITPQIARVVATRLRDRPAPWRLCYDGTVIRRRRGRARRQRQIAQIGAECVGVAGAAADAEVMRLAAAACGAAGLRRLHLEVGHVGIARAALAALPPESAEAATEALAAKDGARLDAVCAHAGAPDATHRTLRRLLELDALEGGDPARTLARARRSFTTPDAARALDEVDAVLERLAALGGLGSAARDAVQAGPADAAPGASQGSYSIGLDLGEVRGFGYYTGVRFALLARGPGEPVGGGGRYDDLLGRFDMPAPATGFGLDLEHLDWALAAERGGAGTDATRAAGRWVVTADDSLAAERLAALLRADGEPACAIPAPTGGALRDAAEAAVAFARAWGYDVAVALDADGSAVLRDARGGGRAVAIEAPVIAAAVAAAQTRGERLRAALSAALARGAGDDRVGGDAPAERDIGPGRQPGRKRG